MINGKLIRVGSVVTPARRMHPEHGHIFRVVELKLWAPQEHMVIARSVYDIGMEIKLPESQLMLWEDYM